MELTLFQQDLRNGMTIKEALQKHKITLKQAMHKAEKTYKRPKKPKKQKNIDRLITHRNNHYYLRKRVNGKQTVFGTYQTLEDAIRMREYCEKHGWEQKSISRYCQELGIERCRGPNKGRVRYS